MNPQTELFLRVACFAAIFAGLAVWEALSPCRAPRLGRKPRWPNNLAILAIDILAVRTLVPLTAVGAALMAGANGWGLLNLVRVPAWLAGIVGFVVLDFAIYWQHYIFHHVPWLWRLHRMHHADLDIDVTTGLRFHPIEILISMLIKIAVVLAVGIPAYAVVAFEIVLNATSMFNHANLALPRWLDRILRLLVVTPDMHRVHHSIVRQETDSNFGFNLPWWDRLFRTYRAEPEAGHQGMTIGIPIFRDPVESRIDRLITQPFRDSEQRAD